MADFNQALQKVLHHEGGYVNDPDDPGGETYKGVARKVHSKWDGWQLVDLYKQKPGFPENLDACTELQEKITDFYQLKYWDRIQGDKITGQSVAESIFDFAVNAGPGTSVRLAQLVIGATADGVIGPKSLEKLNLIEEELFQASFIVAKISRYMSIIKRRPTSKKYLYGWILRTLNK